MIWKLFHRLFGWHYVQFSNCIDSYILRVQSTPTGRLYVSPYLNMVFLDMKNTCKLLDDGSSYYMPLTFDNIEELV